MDGVLYVVATPIGNLADITYRAVETLKSAARIACEDTRQTRKLLDHYGIHAPLVSYHDHNEAARTAELLERLAAGESVALVSDAGTPLVSDPGYRLVRAAVERGFRVVPIPGACAAVTALSAAGLPADDFRFIGFLPARQGERRRALAEFAAAGVTLICYEAPHRVLEALDDIAAALGDPQVAAARELTKLHEEFLRGRASAVRAELASRPAIRGEFTLIIGKAEQPPAKTEVPLAEAVAALERAGVARMDAIKQVARDRGLGKREVYRELERA